METMTLLLAVGLLLVALALLVLAVGVRRMARTVTRFGTDLNALAHPEPPAQWAVHPFPGYRGEVPMMENGDIRALLDNICQRPAPTLLLDEHPDASENERWTASVVDAHAGLKISTMARLGCDLEPTPGFYSLPWARVYAPTREEAEAKGWHWISENMPATVVRPADKR